MYAYTEILKPSVASQLQILPLGDNGTPLLFVLRGGSLLQVFSDLESGSPRWVAEFTLEGHAVALQKVDNRYLAIAFKPSRMVLVEWQLETLTIHTRSLHYYEKLPPSNKNFTNIGHNDEINFRLLVNDRLNEILFRFQHNLASFLLPETVDPLLDVENVSEKPKRSEILTFSDLLEINQLSHAVDICFLPSYNSSTIALIADTKPTWAGFAAVDGSNTRNLVISSTSPFNVITQVPNISNSFENISPLQQPASALAVLWGRDKLALLIEDLEVAEIDLDMDLSDCIVEQLHGTHSVVINTNDGSGYILNTKTLKLAKIDIEFPKIPASITSFNGILTISSHCSGICLFRYASSSPATDTEADAIQINSINDIVEFVGNSNLNDGLNVDRIGEIPGYGSFTSVATIDNGLACTTHTGVLIVERNLPLYDLETVLPKKNVRKGRFWITGDEEKRLIYVEEPDKPADVENQSKKRKVELKTIFSKWGGRDMSLPRSLSKTQETLLVKELGEKVVIVQTSTILVFSKWKLQNNIKLSKDASIAEAHGNYILVVLENGSVVYDHELNELKTISSSLCSISATGLIVSAINAELSLSRAEGSDIHKYNVSDLGSCVKPGNLDYADTESAPKPISVYALIFGGVEYIGIHLNNRLFVIYELLSSKSLIKRYVVPFAVNQSPIWLENNEMLVFPGNKSHTVVKGRHCPFACHQLQLYGSKLLDIVEVSEGFVWLDMENQLHHCRLDETIDHHTAALPVRLINLPQSATIKSVVYHDLAETILVGANVLVPKNEEEEDDDDENKDNDEEEGEEPEGEEPEDETVKSEAQESETPSGETQSEELPKDIEYIHNGRVFALSLHNYKFQEYVLELNETLLSMKLLDKPPSEQLLAIGTSIDAIETQETNGYIRLYTAKGSEDGTSMSFSPFDSELLRGPVSSITELMGFMAISHGAQIKVYDYRKGLEPVGFYDMQIYMQDMKSIRNMLVLGERIHTPRLVNFALQPRRLDLLSSADPIAVGSGYSPTSAIEAISSASRGDLAVVCSTRNGVLQLYKYDPESIDSGGGHRLIPEVSFYTGSLCVALAQVQFYFSDDIACFGVTSDGCLFSVKPLAEDVFRTVFLLTQQMVEKEQSGCGLNPRMHRRYYSPHSSGSGNTTSSGTSSGSGFGDAHQMLDINYAQRFWSLTVSRQILYTKNLGYEGLKKVQQALNGEGRDALKL